MKCWDDPAFVPKVIPDSEQSLCELVQGLQLQLSTATQCFAYQRRALGIST